MFDFKENDLLLLNSVQSNFPICHDPFAVIADELNLSKTEVIERLEYLKQQGAIARFGGVLNHKKNGASTLAALKVPLDKINQTAELVSTYREVNHNYLREHEFNLWFVVTAKQQCRVNLVLNELKEATGFDLLNLPMVKSHHINLAFQL